jgi:hypothetical protein
MILGPLNFLQSKFLNKVALRQASLRLLRFSLVI